MGRIVSSDGWQKSSRSGSANTDCVEVKITEA